jgi:hypothetical protein
MLHSFISHSYICFMTDQLSLLTANMAMLIAAVAELTSAVNGMFYFDMHRSICPLSSLEHTRVCMASSVIAPTQPAPQELDPAAGLSELSLTPSPPSTPGPQTSVFITGS